MGMNAQYESPSKYFKASDIVGANGQLVAYLTLTIKSVGEETFDDGRKQPSLQFVETDKSLGLNKTNREKIAELFGSDNGTGMLDWEVEDVLGKKIQVFRSKTQTKEGSTVDCVRIRAAAAAPAQRNASAAPAGMSEMEAWTLVKSHFGSKEAATPAWKDLKKKFGTDFAAMVKSLSTQTADELPPEDLSFNPAEFGN